MLCPKSIGSITTDNKGQGRTPELNKIFAESLEKLIRKDFFHFKNLIKPDHLLHSPAHTIPKIAVTEDANSIKTKNAILKKTYSIYTAAHSFMLRTR